MKSYYNDKKYYVKRALKIAKECGNKEAIILLQILERDKNTFSIKTIELINSLHFKGVDLFNIELNKD